jgi:hypothetical protein
MYFIDYFNNLLDVEVKEYKKAKGKDSNEE